MDNYPKIISILDTKIINSLLSIHHFDYQSNQIFIKLKYCSLKKYHLIFFYETFN